MRQAGVIAAAGIVAIEKMTARLAEDHANARRLCEGLNKIPGISAEGSYSDYANNPAASIYGAKS